MGLVISFIKIVSIIATAAFGAMGLLTNYRDEKGKITKWGKIALAGMAISSILSLALHILETSKQKAAAARAQMEAEATTRALKTILEKAKETATSQQQNLKETNILKSGLEKTLRQQRLNLAQAESNMQLTQELTRAIGKHDLFPRFWFFSGSGMKAGNSQAYVSTFPIIILNPGDYPIYDVDIRFVEVLEERKWQSELWPKLRGGGHVEVDATGNIIPPPYVITRLHFPVLLPKVYYQKEIPAPPSTDKTEFVYNIAVSARNGEMRYRYRYLRNATDLFKPFLFRTDFWRAYKIMKIEHVAEKSADEFVIKLIEEYHDPQFPTSEDGAIDYGPYSFGYAETSPQ